MITEEEFLKAVETVKTYQQQVNDIAYTVLPNNPQPLKKGDIIVFTKVNRKSMLVKVGEKYRVTSFEYRMRNSKHNLLDEHLIKKFGKNYEEQIRTKDERYKFYQREIPLSGLDYWAHIKIDLGNNHYRDILTDRGYEYKLIPLKSIS